MDLDGASTRGSGGRREKATPQLELAGEDEEDEQQEEHNSNNNNHNDTLNGEHQSPNTSGDKLVIRGRRIMKKNRLSHRRWWSGKDDDPEERENAISQPLLPLLNIYQK